MTISILVRASIVLLASLAAVRMAKRAPAAWRALILTSTFGVLSALPLAMLVAPPMSVALPILETRPVASRPVTSGTQRSTGLPTTTTQPRPEVDARPRRSFSVESVVAAVWAIGALLITAPLIAALYRGARLMRGAVVWNTGVDRVAQMASDAGVRARINVGLHSDLVVPMTSGFARPVILLPADAPRWGEADLRNALLHEIEHVRRGDWLVLLAARAIAALYWFHPLAWIAWRRLRLEIERACDDSVIQQADHVAYAEQLVTLARRLSNRAPVPLVPMAYRSQLATRVAAILDPHQRRGRATRISARLTMATTIGVLLAIASVRIVPTYARQSRGLQDAAVTRTGVGSRATLTGTVYDPLGMPVEGLLVYIESGAFGSGATADTLTDKAGQYTFERLPPGVYSISSPVDFAPVIVVTLDEGQQVRQDLRMHIEEVTSVYSVCVDCGPTAPKYVPPESIVSEFASDRTAATSHTIIGAEPAVGWEYYEPDVPITDTIRDRGLTGTVVLEARVETDGAVRNVSVVSSPHAELSAAAQAALQNERWKAASVGGVPVAVPLRLTIEFLRRGEQR